MVALSRRVAELRRQRLLHALPDRRRAADLLHRPLGRRASSSGPAVRQPGARPAGHAAGAARHQAAVQPQASPATATRRRTSRPNWTGLLMERAIKAHMRDFVALAVLLLIGIARERLHPVQPAALPAEVGAGRRQRLLQGERRVLDRAGRDPRPGPDRERGGRGGRRDLEGGAAQRRGGGGAEDPPQVRADLQGRAHAAAPEDRPQGHDRGDGPRHQGSRGAARGRGDPDREHGAGREPRRDPLEPRQRHALLPADPRERRRRGAGRRRSGRPARDAQALRAHQPGPRARHEAARRAAPEPEARGAQLLAADERARHARPPAR